MGDSAALGEDTTPVTSATRGYSTCNVVNTIYHVRANTGDFEYLIGNIFQVLPLLFKQDTLHKHKHVNMRSYKQNMSYNT